MNKGERLRSYLDRAVTVPGETACSQPFFPQEYCTCALCSAVRRDRQQSVLLVPEDPDLLMLELYRRIVLPVT